VKVIQSLLFFKEVQVTAGGGGILLGSVVRRLSLLTSEWDLLDCRGVPVLHISGPLFTFSLLNDVDFAVNY
jgi:hypothetical protein